MPKRLTKVDDLVRRDHWYLEPSDECYFLGEYTARKGYSYSDTNNLIYNLKKSPERKGRHEWQYKERAIRKAGIDIRASLIEKAINERLTLVPIPPSKSRTDPMYDDRMIRVLSVVGEGLNADIRELVVQKESTEAAHERAHRPDPSILAENYIINESASGPVRDMIIVCDDVLTTGSHFKAIQMTLRGRYPDTPVIGVFVARRVPDAMDIEEFGNLDL